MKNRIKILVIAFINYSTAFVYRIIGNRNSNRVLVVTPSWEGSLGDEAVLTAITARLAKEGKEVTLIHWGDSNEWNCLKYVSSKISMTYFFQTGGWRDQLRLIFLLPRYNGFYLMGTDMLDGCYADWLTLGMLRITHQAAMTGMRTTLVGFSINTWQNSNCIAALKSMPSSVRFCVRDEVSLERIKNLTGRTSAMLTADMAFLLEPDANDAVVSNALEWIRVQHLNQRIVVGVNINPQLSDGSETFLDSLVTHLSDAMKQLQKTYNEPLSFLLLPHDFRSYNSDVMLLESLFMKLEGLETDSVYFLKNKPSAAGIKAVVQELDVVMTGRMHIAIATLGSQKPLGCLVYQGKFEGLFRHFKLSDQFLLQPGSAMNTNVLFEFLKNLLNHRSFLQQQISDHWEDVKRRSAANL